MLQMPTPVVCRLSIIAASAKPDPTHTPLLQPRQRFIPASRHQGKVYLLIVANVISFFKPARQSKTRIGQ